MFDEFLYKKYLKTKDFGRSIVTFEELESTSAYLLSGSFPAFHLCFAESQTAGRGRSGRKWISPKGDNLCFSILMPQIELKRLLPLNIVTGFAVCDALKEYCDVKLKWPNDIMAEGKKISGILFETSINGSTVEKVVLGIGINVNMTEYPAEIEATSSSLASICGKKLCREKVLAEIMNKFEKLYTEFQHGDINIVGEWGKYSASLDKKITLHKNGEKASFIERGITSSGFLIAENEKNEITEIVSGDIGYDFSN